MRVIGEPSHQVVGAARPEGQAGIGRHRRPALGTGTLLGELDPMRGSVDERVVGREGDDLGQLESRHPNPRS